MSDDAEFDKRIASSLADGPFGGAGESGGYAAAIEDRIKVRAKRRKGVIRLAALLGAAIASLGVYAFVPSLEQIFSPTWQRTDETLVSAEGGGALLLAVVVIAIIAECLPQSR